MKDNRQKPRVGIIYSDTTKKSKESIHLAEFFAAILSHSGYSEIHLVGYNSESLCDSKPFFSRLSVYHPAKGRLLDVSMSNIHFSNWSRIVDCHVIVVVVNSYDSSGVADKLNDILKQQKNVTIFSLQRGVKNSTIVKTSITSTTGCVVVEGLIGFAIIPDSRSQLLQPSLPNCTIFLERLSKDIVATAEGPVNLLEATDIPILYKKILTPNAWGVLVFETVFALNALTGDSIRTTLSIWRWRLIFATMIRESCRALEVAAGGGGWQPKLDGICSISPKTLEMVLVLPNPLFFMVASLVSLPLPTVISPLQLDLLEGRESNLQYGLEELVNTGRKYSVKMPICELILAHIRAMEITGGGGGRAGYSTSPQVLSTVENMIFKSTPPSIIECLHWVVRTLLVLSLLPVLYFLFLH